MEPGTSYWLWYLEVPGRNPIPVGVFDHPADPDVPTLRSVHVGRSRVVQYGNEVTELQDELSDLLSLFQPLP